MIDKKRFLYSFIILFLLVFSDNHYAFAEQPVGLLVAGYEKDCSVKRASDNSIIKCEFRMELYKDDVITKMPDAKSIKIQWVAPPYTKMEASNKTQLQVVANWPKNRGTLATAMHEFLSFMQLSKTQRSSQYMVSRAFSTDRLLQPGYDVTVLPQYPVTFAWVGHGQTIFFTDRAGEVIYTKKLSGESSISLMPDEIGLKLGELYNWGVRGFSFDKPPVLKVLDDDRAQEIVNGLNSIDKEQDISVDEKNLHKAAYLQLLSEVFPKEVDLYWLSYIYLKQSRESETRDELIENYKIHKKQND